MVGRKSIRCQHGFILSHLHYAGTDNNCTFKNIGRTSLLLFMITIWDEQKERGSQVTEVNVNMNDWTTNGLEDKVLILHIGLALCIFEQNS